MVRPAAAPTACQVAPLICTPAQPMCVQSSMVNAFCEAPPRQANLAAAASCLMECRGDCMDLDKRCSAWAAQGECSANPGYMRQSCCRACEAAAAAA